MDDWLRSRRLAPQEFCQYGLIAEEVVPLYLELVGYGPDGKVQTVRYHDLIPMLVNELQKQSKENQRQAKQIEQQAARNRQLSAQLAELKGRLSRR